MPFDCNCLSCCDDASFVVSIHITISSCVYGTCTIYMYHIDLFAFDTENFTLQLIHTRIIRNIFTTVFKNKYKTIFI